MGYFFADELENSADVIAQCEREYGKGDLRALAQALSICATTKMTPPTWICNAVSNIVEQNIRAQKRRGRGGNFRAKLKQDTIHKLRWATVKHLRVNCRERAPTWERVFVEASYELRGTAAQGSEETMRRSYKLHRHDRLADKFYRLLGPEYLVKLAEQIYQERYGPLQVIAESW
jgi:hypothetical protein